MQSLWDLSPANEDSYLARLGVSPEHIAVPGLHAKGVVTPLGVITGSTNVTRSGLYAQAQNSNYFAHDHPGYSGNRTQLLHVFRNTSQPVLGI